MQMSDLAPDRILSYSLPINKKRPAGRSRQAFIFFIIVRLGVQNLPGALVVHIRHVRDARFTGGLAVAGEDFVPGQVGD